MTTITKQNEAPCGCSRCAKRVLLVAARFDSAAIIKAETPRDWEVIVAQPEPRGKGVRQ